MATKETKKDDGNGKGNLPSHSLYLNRKMPDGKYRSIQVGAAWPQKDGKGFNIQFDGMFSLRERRNNNSEDEGS